MTAGKREAEKKTLILRRCGANLPPSQRQELAVARLFLEATGFVGPDVMAALAVLRFEPRPVIPPVPFFLEPMILPRLFFVPPSIVRIENSVEFPDNPIQILR